MCSINKAELSRQLSEFLKMYRNTPIRATGCTPAEMVLRYNPNCKIPSFDNYTKQSTKSIYDKARERDVNQKKIAKEAADIEQKRYVTSCIKAGDLVLVKYKNPKKSQPVFDPHPFTVTERVGNRVYLKRNGKPLHFIKKYLMM